MATAKKVGVELERLRLEPQGDDGTMKALYRVDKYRFLFSDGRTLDVWAIEDSSWLREAVLDYAKAGAIVGVATVETKGAAP